MHEKGEMKRAQELRVGEVSVSYFEGGKSTSRILWLLGLFVPELGCVSQDSDSLVSQRGNSLGEARCRKSRN